MKKKIEKKVFIFQNDCICIGCVNLSLLIRESLWQTVNELKTNRKIFSIAKRVFVEVNCLRSDQ